MNEAPPMGEAVAWGLVLSNGALFRAPLDGHIVVVESEHDAEAVLSAYKTHVPERLRPVRVVPLFTHPTPSVPQTGVTREYFDEVMQGWRTYGKSDTDLYYALFPEALRRDATAPQDRT